MFDKYKPSFFTSKKKKQSNAEALTAEGLKYLQAKDYSSAIEAFTIALQNISDNHVYFINRASAYLHTGSYDLCFQDCAKSLSIQPSALAYCTEARAYWNLNQFHEAITSCENGVKVSKRGDTEALSLLSTIKAAKSKYEAELHKVQGDEVMVSNQNFKAAIEAYTKAIHCLPNNTSYLNRRALAYLLNGQNEFVIYDCDKSIAIQANGKAYGRKAAALCNMEQLDEALECIGKALELLPENKELINTQQVILDRVEAAHSYRESSGGVDFGSMALTCTLALKFSKKSYVHYNNRAIAHLGAGELEKAIEDCHESLKIKENMKSYRNLALIYCEQKNLIEAFQYIDIALKMSPTDGLALDVRRKLERIQHGIDQENAMTRELQIKEENDLYDAQVSARVLRLVNKKIRLEKQAIRVRKNYSKLFAKKMVKKGLTKVITDYANLRAFYWSEESNLLRNQMRARGTRTILKQETDLLKQQAYARARRQKPPPNTIMSNFFKYELSEDNSAKNVVILDKRLNIKPVDADDNNQKPAYSKMKKISNKILNKLKNDWSNLQFSITYTSEEELVISFDTISLRDKEGSRLRDSELAQYMTLMAVSGITAKAKLRPMNDRWRVLEMVNFVPKPVPRSRRGHRSNRSTPYASPIGTPIAKIRKLSDPKLPLSSPATNVCTQSPAVTPNSKIKADSTNSNNVALSATIPILDNGSPVINSPTSSRLRLLKKSKTFNDALFALNNISFDNDDCSSLEEESVQTKEVLVFAFYVPIYKKNDVSVHGAGSVHEEIRLIEAYEAYNKAKQLKPLAYKSTTTSTKKNKLKGKYPKVKLHTVLPPLDVYGTLESDKKGYKKSKPIKSKLKTVITSLSTSLSIPESYLSVVVDGEDIACGDKASELEVYKPETMPKDFKLYNTSRNLCSW